MGVSGEWFCWIWFGGVEADPQTKVFGHHWGGRPHPVGVKPYQPPVHLANRTLIVNLFTGCISCVKWDSIYSGN